MRIVKANQVMHAEPINDTIDAPAPGGGTLAIARPGDWAVWSETEEGFTFKAFMSDRDLRDKHQTI